MLKTMKRFANQNGFGVIETLLVLVILGFVGFTGWFVYSSNKVADKNYEAANTSSSSEQSRQQNALNKTYKDPVGKFGFKYPANWTLKSVSNTDDAEYPYSDVTITSPGGSKLKIGNDWGGRGGMCDPEPTDKPFAVNNTCSTLEILSVEKIDINNVYYGQSQEDANGSIDYIYKPTDIVLVTSHFADNAGKHEYTIGLRQSNSDNKVVTGMPEMGLVSPHHFFSVANNKGKYFSNVYAHASGLNEEFLKSKDAKTIKAILRTFSVEI